MVSDDVVGHSDPVNPWTVIPITAPDSLADPAAWGLHGAVATSRALEVVERGHLDLAYTPEYLAAQLRNTAYTTHRMAVAVPDTSASTPGADDVAGVTVLSLPLADNTHLMYLDLYVHPAHVRNGVATALMHDAERFAAEHDRRTVIAWTSHTGEPPADTPGVLEPPTGAGRIRPDDPAALFALRHGYVLEQGERYSVLHLPVDPELLDRLHAEAAEAAGTDYRLHTWTDRVPDEWVDQAALLESRMSTEAPTAGLEMGEDVWDAGRLRAKEVEIAEAGHSFVMVAAEHVPTGTLAAFTFVRCPLDQPEVVHQEDTLVLPEHRGRRLGMLVKAALLIHLRDAAPKAERIHTWNAEENAHMLAINVALGFRPTGVAGMWQKRL